MGEVVQFIDRKRGVPTLRNAPKVGSASTSAPARAPDPVAVEMRASGFDALVVGMSMSVAKMLRDIAAGESRGVAKRLHEVANAFGPVQGGDSGE